MTWLPLGFSEGLAYSFAILGLYLAFVKHGFPDLTFDGSFALGAAVTAAFIMMGFSPILATSFAFLGGACAGSLTASLFLALRLNKLLCGLIVSGALYTINLRLMGRSSLPLLGKTTIYSVFGLSELLGQWLVPIGLLTLILVTTSMFLATSLGTAVRAFPSNEERVALLGLPYSRLTLLALALSNGLVALSGSLVAQRQGFAAVDMGLGAIIWGLAALLLGLPIASILGRFDLLSPVIGSLLFMSLLALALYLGLPPTDLRLATALLLVACLVLGHKLGHGHVPHIRI